MSNIIDTIRVSGTDYTLSAQTSGGITSGEVQSMIDESISGKADSSAITESLATKVNVVDNNVPAFSGVPLAINVNEGYDSLQLKTIYIKNNDVTQHTNVVFGVIMYYNGSYIVSTYISGSSISSSGITAITNTDTTAHTFTLENGVCRIDFLGSCHFCQISSEGDGFSFYYIHNNNYTSGQSSTVIENTVYDALTKLGEDIVDMNDSGRFVNITKAQDITGQKNFIGDKGIKFSQKTSTNKPGFVIYAVDTANTTTEAATFEFRPNTFTETISGTTIKHPLLYFGHYRTTAIANKGIPQTVVGFRQYDQPNAAAYHMLAPLPDKAKTPFSLTTKYQDFYMPMGFKVDSSTMIKTDNTGIVDLSSYIGDGITSGDVQSMIDESVSGKQDTLISGTNIKTINNESLLGSGNIDIQGGGSSYTAGDGIDITNNVISVTGKVDTSAITTSITSSSTDAQVPSAKAVNDKLGGLSIVKLTQAQYDALSTKDSNTLYVITTS